MEGCPTVQTENGAVKGKTLKAVDPSARIVYSYLGIPYGQPPVGKLRFLPPKKAEPWNGTLKAVHTFKNCPQNSSIAIKLDEMIPFKNELNHDPLSSDEDCLKLNVFTPECYEKAKKPVMVWLSGGAYQRHYAGRRNGSALAGMEDCVVVVPNFRVNVFGFFSLGKGTSSSGNNGLRDAILALEWVRDNISAFGGDRNNVTLFGESSGAGMVHLLMMSPMSSGLFHKAILQSGTALSPFLFSQDLSQERDMFLKRFGLNIATMEEGQILEKLQAIPADEIVKVLPDFEPPHSFMPTIDGQVITDSPTNLLKAGHVCPVPLMIGCTDSECMGMLPMRAFPNYVKGFSEQMAKTIFLNGYNKAYKNDIGEKIFDMAKKRYLKDESEPLAYSKLYGSISSDTVFIVPSILAASAHVAMGLPTFYYLMTQQPEFNHSEKNGPEITNRPDFVGCDHSDDLHFVWGEPFEEGALSGGAYFTDDEVELSRNVMRYFVNFAKSGNPNEPVTVLAEWPAYRTEGNRQNMVLQQPLKTDVNFALDKVLFVTQDIPRANMP